MFIILFCFSLKSFSQQRVYFQIEVFNHFSQSLFKESEIIESLASEEIENLVKELLTSSVKETIETYPESFARYAGLNSRLTDLTRDLGEEEGIKTFKKILGNKKQILINSYNKAKNSVLNRMLDAAESPGRYFAKSLVEEYGVDYIKRFLRETGNEGLDSMCRNLAGSLIDQDFLQLRVVLKNSSAGESIYRRITRALLPY
jgi:hypothetical protein